MQTTQPRNRLPHRLGLKWHAALAKRVAAVFALAAVVALTVHYANRGLEAAWPDPFHPAVGAATPASAVPERPPALAAQPEAPYFPSQFPAPPGPVEPQPEPF
jgi:hypothetical protein